MGPAAAPLVRKGRESCLVPPPPIRDGDGDEPSAMDVLREFDGDAALCLWTALRRTHGRILDGTRGPGRSPSDAAPDGCAQLRDVLPALRVLLGTDAPAQPDDRCLGDACDRVRSWCEESERYRTAALFAEAAAYLMDGDPAAANTAARSCRQAVLYHRAGHWYQRGQSLAVRLRDQTEAVQALLSAGVLMYHLGHHGTPRTFLRQAKTRAVHSGRRRQAAHADHDLMLLAAEAGQLQSGIHHAAEALRLYPLSNPRVPYFAHDYAHFLTRLRVYTPALPLLRAALELLPRPVDQVLIASTIARAAAGAGQTRLYDDAAGRVLALIGAADQYAAPAYKNLAVAAWQLRAWGSAAQFASLTIEVAEPRQEREPLQTAKRLQDRIADRSPPPPPRDPPSAIAIEALQRRCFMGLKVWQRRTARGQVPPATEP